MIPPHTEGVAHVHAGHESGIYVVSGTHTIRYGQALESSQVLEPGDLVYIPADVPHMPVTGAEPVVVVVARTDPHEQESVHLLEGACGGQRSTVRELSLN
ncbi:cupin domain-containing protein [Catellatospora sp. TT07R-123]|uniref:cupin domain-containing protein n=1 Tax=Catellatospora sp. TT07R-123 TaxID=2733863 RepID=UPI001BB3AB1D|nr:cupin domain-containing protein [Catellatospora sp. TT07R-123]